MTYIDTLLLFFYFYRFFERIVFQILTFKIKLFNKFKFSPNWIVVFEIGLFLFQLNSLIKSEREKKILSFLNANIVLT